MNRMAARAGQLSRTSATRSRLGAAHSPPHCTAGVDRRVDAPNADPTLARCPHRAADTSEGTVLTRAVATRYIGPDRSTVIADMHTAFAGSGDMTTSSISLSVVVAR